MTRRIGLLGAVALLVSVLVAVAPEARAAEWTSYETTIVNPADGTRLHAYVIRPPGVDRDEPTPVSLIVSPYLNSGGGGPFLGSPDPLRERPFTEPHWPALVLEHGFTEVQVEPRGFGGSTGCVDFGGPGEQSDVRAAIEWSVAQPWSTGRVGIFGWSYEGGMAASAVRYPPPGLAAAFLGVPVTSFYRYVQTNGVNNTTDGETIYNVPQAFMPPSANGDHEYLTAYAEGAGADPRCHVEATVAARTQRYETDPYWAERDYVIGAAESDVPVFFVGGFQDENVVPQYILPYVNSVGGPRRAWLAQMEHEPPAAWQWHAEAVDWFRHYVAGEDVEVQIGFVIQSRDGSYRTDRSWPHDDIRPMTVPLVPGSYRELEYTLGDGNDTDLWPPMGAIPPELARPAVHWAAVTQPLAYEVHLSGEAELRVDVELELPVVNVVAVVLDVDTDGHAHYLTRGAHLTDRSGTVALRLFPQDWRLRPGHRLAVYLAGASSVHYNASNRWLGSSGGEVRVLGGTLSLPTLVHERLPCTDFSQRVLGTDVIFRLSSEEAAAAAVDAVLPGDYSGRPRRCR